MGWLSKSAACLSIICGCFFAIGLLNLITNFEPNRCEMTYMFEYPQFIEIYSERDQAFPRYGLYAYSEGRLTEKIRKGWFSGIPILFIPGNAGSYKQVRSLASLALRKMLKSRMGFHFDFFTVDLNDELSGLCGSTLNEQVEYVQHSIETILDLYKWNKHPQTSVILIGHSMGGVIARKCLLDDKYSSNIEIVITLSTPHERPPLNIDYYIDKFYRDMYKQDCSKLANKSIISIAGGFNDKLVPPIFTESHSNTLNVLTDTIPTVWLTADHTCIVWCKQLVKTIINSLISVVDQNSNSVIQDSNVRRHIFSHYFVQNSGIKISEYDRYLHKAFIRSEGEWIWLDASVKTLSYEHVKTTQYVALPLKKNRDKSVFIRTTNLKHTDWLYLCSVGNESKCEQAWHLTHFTSFLPSDNFKRRAFLYDVNKLFEIDSTASHVLIKLLPTDKFVEIQFEFYNKKERSNSVDVSNMYSNYNRKVVNIDAKTYETISHRLELISFQHLYQSLFLHVKTRECYNSHAVFSLVTPWTGQITHGYIGGGEQSKYIPLRLMKPKPSGDKTNAFVDFILDPSCQYHHIKIEGHFFGAWGQFVQYHVVSLLANVCAILILALQYQLTHAYCNKNYPPLHTSILNGCNWINFLIVIEITGEILGLEIIKHHIVPSDFEQLKHDNMYFKLLPLILFMTALAITYVLSLVTWCVVIFTSANVHSLAIKLLSKVVVCPTWWSESLLNALHRLPCVGAALTIALAMSTCGAVGLTVGACFYFLKMTKMYDEYLEDILFNTFKVIAKKVAIFLKQRILNYFKREHAIRPTTLQLTNLNNSLSLTDSADNESSSPIESSPIESIIPTPSDASLLTESDKNESTLSFVLKLSQESQDDLLDMPLGEKKHSKESDGESKSTSSDGYEKLSAESDHIDVEDDKSESSVEKVGKLLIGMDNESSDNISDESDKNSISEYNDQSGNLLDDGNDNRMDNDVDSNNGANEDTVDKTDDDIFVQITNTSALRSLNFHFNLFFLWCLVTALNVPLLLTWTHNFYFETSIKNDQSFIPSIIMGGCAVILWQMDLPKMNLKYNKTSSQILYGLAVIAILFGSTTIYRLNFIIAAVFLVVTLLQWLSPFTCETEDDDEENIFKFVVDKLKLKLNLA